jgi:hypothetical protein
VSDEPVPGWEPCAGAWVDAGWLTGLAGAFFPLYREPDRHAYEAPGS